MNAKKQSSVTVADIR